MALSGAERWCAPLGRRHSGQGGEVRCDMHPTPRLVIDWLRYLKVVRWKSQRPADRGSAERSDRDKIRQKAGLRVR